MGDSTRNARTCTNRRAAWRVMVDVRGTRVDAGASRPQRGVKASSARAKRKRPALRSAPAVGIDPLLDLGQLDAIEALRQRAGVAALRQLDLQAHLVRRVGEAERILV